MALYKKVVDHHLHGNFKKVIHSVTLWCEKNAQEISEKIQLCEARNLLKTSVIFANMLHKNIQGL